jgi:predicted small integral membrane protein
MFDWMAWTLPVAVFFCCIVLMLIAMTVWELKSPTVMRKGFLPIATTRGDRLFVGLLSAAYLNLAFVDQLRNFDVVACARDAQGLAFSTNAPGRHLPGWRADVIKGKIRGETNEIPVECRGLCARRSGR